MEPDVVLYAYGGKCLTQAVRRQTASELWAMLLRITLDGVEPAGELRPGQ